MEERAADAAAEPRGGDVLEPVRLVEDDHVVVRQHPPVPPLAQAEVGEVERVVDDHEVGVLGALARRLREAGAGEAARAAEAAVRSDRELGPQAPGRLHLELGAVAGLGRVEPPAQRVEGAAVLLLREERPAEELEAVQAVPADVVVAALQHRDVDLAAERGRGAGHVLGEELLLERLRRRRDDDAEPRVERGNQVGEALAGPGARLGQQMPPPRDRERDRLRQLGLLLARLEPVEDPRQRPVRSEHVPHGTELRRRGGRRRRNVARSELFRVPGP